MKKKTVRKQKETIPFTKEGYQNFCDERDALLLERPEAVSDLQKAREMGDLSENGYYKASRARLSFIDAQIRRIDRLLKSAVIVESLGNETVGIGNTIVVSDGIGEYTYTIVGGYESDPSKNTISHMSPIGKALTGKKEGEKVVVRVPAGEKTYTVIKIT